MILELVGGLFEIMAAHPVMTLLVVATVVIYGADAGTVERAAKGTKRSVTAAPGGEAFVLMAIAGFVLGFGGTTPGDLVSGVLGAVADLISEVLP